MLGFDIIGAKQLNQYWEMYRNTKQDQANSY